MSSSHYPHPASEMLRQVILDTKGGQEIEKDFINATIEHYSEPWRHYHNCNHILNMFGLLISFDTSHLTQDELQALRYMIIFHDVIYKINRDHGWSERQSALLGSLYVSKVVTADVEEMIIRGIEASAHHTCDHLEPEWIPTISLFLDLDLLAGLGTSWESFVDNTALIQREYEPLYTEAEFSVGRKKWAAGMLHREKIYLTTYGAPYEEIARKNFERLIATN